jgi:hypothetical protein
MPIASLRFHVLNVGQGACNFVEILDANNNVLHNILIDLGTASRSLTLSARNVEWLNDRIKNRADPRIDLVILTHGDFDHYGLITQLAPGLGQPANQARIGMVRYGNPSWRFNSKSRGDTIKWLKTYCNDVNGCESRYSGYDAINKKWDYLWTVPDPSLPVYVGVVIVNVPHPEKGNLDEDVIETAPNGEIVNGESLVSMISWNDRTFVATGDATGNTFKAINDHLLNVPMPTATMMTMPHHGSRRSTYDLDSARDDIGDEARKTVKDFVGIFKPRNLTVSANMHKGFLHPFVDVLNQFSEYLDPYQLWVDPKTGDQKNHFLNAYYLAATTADGEDAGPAIGNWATTETAKNIYSTRYFSNDRYNEGKLRSTARKAVKTNNDVDMLVVQASGVLAHMFAPLQLNATNKKKRGRDEDETETYYPRYTYPPGPATILSKDDTKTISDIPEYHNWTFTIDSNSNITLAPTPDTASPEQAAHRFVRHAAARADVPATHVLARDQRSLAVAAAATRFVATSGRPSSVERRTPPVSRLGTLRAIP